VFPAIFAKIFEKLSIELPDWPGSGAGAGWAIIKVVVDLNIVNIVPSNIDEVAIRNLHSLCLDIP
jgi:hypothetical protein